MDDPTRFLTTPAEPTASIDAGYVDAFDFATVASPTHWINEFLAELTGTDPLGTVATAFAGNWTAWAKCGEAWGHLADFVESLGENIQDGAVQLDDGWHGNAADAAYAYFGQLAGGTTSLQIGLRNAADSYSNCARGMWALANQAQGLIEAIIDNAVIAAGAASIGSALVETGVGPVVGWGIAAVQTARILDMVSKLFGITQAASMVVNTVFGGGMAIFDQGGSLADATPLPDAPHLDPAAHW